ncbi:hypothetical protein [Streptomyces niveus]|uniref:hypothetical protein n=1 Tax=Streptomyces niveus TaxID=193462 RepID=UPI0036CF315E
MHVLTIDPRDTVTYGDREYRMPQGLAPYQPRICGSEALAATLVARLGLRGYRIEPARYVEEEPRSARGLITDSLGSRAMRVECLADGHAVTWRYDRFAIDLNEAWTVDIDGKGYPVVFGRYMRAHERDALLVWTVVRVLRGWI